MTGFDLSSSIWIDPLVAVTIAVAAYTPVKDVWLRHSHRAKILADKVAERETKLDALLADWHGTRARPGFPEIPGIPARIFRIEQEIQPNHGSSIKDVVHQTDANLKIVKDEVTAIQQKLGMTC